jgi:hypothetical protein
MQRRRSEDDQIYACNNKTHVFQKKQTLLAAESSSRTGAFLHGAVNNECNLGKLRKANAEPYLLNLAHRPDERGNKRLTAPSYSTAKSLTDDSDGGAVESG